MKPTEEARGEQLVAVPAKVSQNHFLIALDNLEQAKYVNSRLLLNGQWIDIPVSYETGKRALVTLELDSTGKKVIASAFEQWEGKTQQ